MLVQPVRAGLVHARVPAATGSAARVGAAVRDNGTRVAAGSPMDTSELPFFRQFDGVVAAQVRH